VTMLEDIKVYNMQNMPKNGTAPLRSGPGGARAFRQWQLATAVGYQIGQEGQGLARRMLWE
jgi:hypothetical protein